MSSNTSSPLRLFPASLFRQLNDNFMAGRYFAIGLLNVLVPLCANYSQSLTTGLLYGISFALLFNDSKVIASGSFLAILHGVTHMVWPFINQYGLAPAEFSAFYDEVVHLLFGIWAHYVMLAITCKDSSSDIKAVINMTGSCIIFGNFLCVVLSTFLPADNEFFIESALFSGLTSGYYAAAALSLGWKAHSGHEWAHIGHQAVFAAVVVFFFYAFRASHDFMAFMFLGRLFESFFMIPLWISLAADTPLFARK